MRKPIIFTMLSVGLMAGNAVAAQRERTPIPHPTDFTKQEVIGELEVNGRVFKVVTPPRSSERRIPTRAAEITPVIKHAPGRVQRYCKDLVGYGVGQPIQAYAVASYINWDDEDAYFYDILTAAPMNSYVKAHMEGPDLVLPMNQTVLTFDDEDYAINMGLMKPVFQVQGNNPNDIAVWFEYSDDYSTISYTISETGSLEPINLPAKYTNEGYDAEYYGFPNYVIGYYYTDDYLWTGYCDVYQIYDEFNFEETVAPEGLEYSTFSYVNMAGMGVVVSVGETEDALYFKNLSAYIPDAVIKGELSEDGTQVAVYPNQYVGIEHNTFFVITSTAQIVNNDVDVVEGNVPVYFNVERDAEGRILSISAQEDDPYILTLNDDPFYFYPADVFSNLVLTSQDTFEGTPSSPTRVYYEDYASMMGANFIFFELSPFAENGDIIDVNKLYYSVFINGEPYEFEEDEGIRLNGEEAVFYEGLGAPTYLVPYTFGNYVDLYEDDGGTFVVALYVEGIETVGVEAVYTWGEKATYSKLVTIDVETDEIIESEGSNAGVNQINMADVVTAEYYNLDGSKALHPSKGIYVKKYTMSDGSVKSNKVIVR